MPIRVACACGKAFAAPDHFAGKRAKCPQCGSPLLIPSEASAPAAAAAAAPPPAPRPPAAPPPPARDLFAEAGIQQRAIGTSPCPGCGAALPEQALLCVACGYHRQLGRRLEGAKVTKIGVDASHGVSVEAALQKAAQTIDEDLAEEAKTRSQGMPAWAYALMLVGLAILTYNIAKIGPGPSLVYLGWFLVVGSAAANAYFGIRYLMVVFEESLIPVLLHFIPLVGAFYGLYYLITRWEKVGKWVLMQLYCTGVATVGYGLIFLGVMIAEASKATPETSIPRQNSHIIVAMMK